MTAERCLGGHPLWASQSLPPACTASRLGVGGKGRLTSDQSRAAHSGGQAGPWQASRTGGRGCGHALSSSAFSSAADTRRWHTTERLRSPASQLRLQRDQLPTTQLCGGVGLRGYAAEGTPVPRYWHTLLLPNNQHLYGSGHRDACGFCREHCRHLEYSHPVATLGVGRHVTPWETITRTRLRRLWF